MQNIVRIIATECPDGASFERIYEDENRLAVLKQSLVEGARTDAYVLKFNLRTKRTVEIIGSFDEIVVSLPKMVVPVGINFYNSVMKKVLSEIEHSMDFSQNLLPYDWRGMYNGDFKLHAVAFSKNLSEIIRKIHVLLAFAGAHDLERIGSLSGVQVFPTDLIRYLGKFL